MNKRKIAIICTVAFFIFIAGYNVFANTARSPEAKLKYQEAVENRNITENLYMKARHELCIAEVEYAEAKATDYFNGTRQLETGENIDSLVAKSQRTCDDLIPREVDNGAVIDYVSKDYPTEYSQPSDLTYNFLRSPSISISQNQRQHFAKNGYLAVDIATNKQARQMLAPSFEFMDKDGNILDQERVFTVKLAHNYDTMGQTIELHWNEGGETLAFWIGHVKDFGGLKDGDTVKTGDPIGISGGCIGELKEGEKSTGCHTHFEFRISGKISPYPSYKFSLHGEELKARLGELPSEPKEAEELCYKHTAEEDQNQYVRYAAKISNNDLDFLATLDAENGLWTPDRIGDGGHGHGFCQVDDRYHQNILDDPNFKDPFWQLDLCREMYVNGVAMYGKNKISKTKKNFTCPNK